MFSHSLSDELALAILEPRHAEPLFRQIDANRDHLRRWMPWVDGSTGPEVTLAFIRGTQRQFAESQGVQTAILLRGETVGAIGMHGINPANRSTLMGYWLAERHQGRGIVTTCCRAYLDHAFGALGLNRVEIRVATENVRSRAIPERLGFRLEGVMRDAEWLYDHFVDHAVYGLLRDEWAAGQSAEPHAEPRE